MAIKIIKNTISPHIDSIRRNRIKAATEAVERGGVIVLGGIITRTPVITGNLKESIGTKTHIENINKLTKPASKVILKIGTAVPYAETVELFSKRNKFFFKRGIGATKNDALKAMGVRMQQLFMQGK